MGTATQSFSGMFNQLVNTFYRMEGDYSTLIGAINNLDFAVIGREFGMFVQEVMGVSVPSTALDGGTIAEA